MPTHCAAKSCNELLLAVPNGGILSLLSICRAQLRRARRGKRTLDYYLHHTPYRLQYQLAMKTLLFLTTSVLSVTHSSNEPVG